MKELIPKDKYGVFADSHDTARVDSRAVAAFFEKSHAHVLRDIANLTESKSGLSDDFIQHNFEAGNYKDITGRILPCFYLTRDGFTMLAMGYTGKKAMHFKEIYICRFNQMESVIKTLVSARKEFPLLTENIRLLHDNPKPHHYSNECDMLNRIVLGMTAKQFREAHGLEQGTSIRPYLAKEQIDLLETLQKVDVGLLLSVPDYQQRKHYLEWYAMKQQMKEVR